MKSYVQVLGGGSRECASHSLYHFLEQNRILFNVSEGLQRLATQFKLKIAPNKLSAVFLTRLDWECFGGLPGLILTMGDTARLSNDNEENNSGVLKIIGPKHTKHAVAAMRPFLHRRDFSVEIEELCVNKSVSVSGSGSGSGSGSDTENKNLIANDDIFSHWRDEKCDVNVWAFELAEIENLNEAELEVNDELKDYNNYNNNNNSYDNNYDNNYDNTTTTDNINVSIDEMEPNHFLLRMFMSQFSVQVSQTEREARCEEYAGRLAQTFKYAGNRSLVYVVQGPTQAGKFDKAAALARGVKPGPLFGKLSKGEVVVLEDGSLVDPKCCVGPKRTSPALMLIDLSTCKLVSAAMKKVSELCELMKKPEEHNSKVEVIIHLLGEEVINNLEILNEYKLFCASLLTENNLSIKHFFCAPNDAVLMSSSVDLQLALSDALNASEYFPSGRQPANYTEIFNNGSENLKLLKPLDRVIVAPDEEICVIEVSKESLSGIGNLDVASLPAETGNNIYISALGTGSAIPGKYRNVSSSLIESYSENGNEMIFLDCGEMTLGQLHRLFGRTRAKEILKRTGAVLISHKHGDHHLGAISLIKAITKLREELVLIAPERFKIWLQEFGQVCDFGLERVKFVACGDLREVPLRLEGTGTLIKAFDVDHCYEAFGFQITFTFEEVKSGCDRKIQKRIVYSGDTRPCDSVIFNAHECDLLVHEATMSNDLLHEAILRKHCTIEEAVGVGIESKSRAVLLTHFSQRYAKGALSLAGCRGIGNESLEDKEKLQIAMGVDLLRFPLKEINKVAKLADRMATLLPVDNKETD